MTPWSDISARFTGELRGFGGALPDELAAALEALAPRMDAEQLDHWAHDGVSLANHSLRSWEAASEYFRASPAVLDRLGVEGLRDWVGIATGLAGSSSLMAAAFLKGTPAALDSIASDDLAEWAEIGERLCRGNWKSIALASLYFQVSPELMRALPLGSVERLVDIIDQLTERSYELANTCLEGAGAIFGSLSEDDREPFLRFARAVTRASWADTRLYFERGPRLLEAIAPAQRAAFLDLAAAVTAVVGRQGFPLFSEAAEAVGQVPLHRHEEILGFSRQLAGGSPAAAMEYLKVVPFVSTRLTPEQMRAWQDTGMEILTTERNPEGAEAYFRLESIRAEDAMRALSSRVELSSVSALLRMYAKALSGEQVAVLSSEELVDKHIGWVTESAATTEGSTIYLPPVVATFEDQDTNFQVYKVFTTHQTARMEFGSFQYRWGRPGEFAPATVDERETVRRDAAPEPAEGQQAAVTAMQRYFNLFEDRTLIAALFTVTEDTRVDALVSREYGGIRRWLHRLQEWEAERRPNVEQMPLRQAFVENLLRASLGRPDTMRWPRSLGATLTEGLAALKLLEQHGATVQDAAEVAASLYDLAVSIPNIVMPPADGAGDWGEPTGEMLSVLPSMPTGASDGPEMPSSSEEMAFATPPQPEFRGDFKPELVQLLARLKNKQDGEQDGAMTPLTKDQIMQMLENSTELSISEWTEGDIGDSLGMFLENLEREAGQQAQQSKEKNKGEGKQEGSGGEDGGGSELPVEIEWFYYDEWDFRAGDYRPRWTRVGERFSKDDDQSDFYQETLRKNHGLVMETRRQFEMMRPESFKKIKRLEDGDELDVDLAVEFQIDKRAGVGPQARIYNRRNKIERDVAVAFLLDMSASTDEEIEKVRQKYDDKDDDDFDGDPRKYFQWLAARRAKALIEPPKRIIDLEKESTVLIVEALEAIGDSYGIYGFSGYGRDNVEFHVIKDLGEMMNDRVEKRIGAIEPIRSTRMGPAIRHTAQKLRDYDAKVKILIMVSDGRPQDHGYGRDRTEKEYAVHDTKQALNEAKRDGITPFLITVDKEGHDYLKQMCDDIGYEVVDDIESLPRRLPTLYRHLAAD